MSDDDKIPTPAFMFGRLRHIELAYGFVLVGKLVVDLPKDVKPKAKRRDLIDGIIARLAVAAQAGELGDEAFGWRDGRRPDNADAFVKSEEAKASWANSHRTIIVCVQTREAPGGGLVIHKQGVLSDVIR
jgi:hypothetical protein